jgi:ATP/maltotriose-dependent transcriptional regulator MalT
VLVVAEFHLAEAFLRSGEPARCRERILRAGGGRELPHNARPYHAYWYGVLTEAALARGDLPEADEWAVRAEHAARDVALEGRRAWALRARAAVLLATGQPTAAADTALCATAAALRADARLEAGRARALAGRCLAAAGQRDDAEDQLLRAEQALSACGARRYADEAAKELRRLGRRVRRAGRRSAGKVGVAALTARELEVAELVARGKRNREIAAELFLSEKTIEANVSKILAKLGVSTRAGVGGTLERSRPGSQP